MKIQIIEDIKSQYFIFEDDSVELDYEYKNHTIQLKCYPKDLVLEIDVWDDLTETQLQFTKKEIDGLLTFFENKLESFYREQESIRDQFEHENYLWNHR